jgi:hypothetical protein
LCNNIDYIIIIRLFRIGLQEQVCTTGFLVHGDCLMITMVAVVSGCVLCDVRIEGTEKVVQQEWSCSQGGMC